METPATISRKRLQTIAKDPKHPMHTHAVSILSRETRNEAVGKFERIKTMINKEKQRDAQKHQEMIQRAKISDIRNSPKP